MRLHNLIYPLFLKKNIEPKKIRKLPIPATINIFSVVPAAGGGGFPPTGAVEQQVAIPGEAWQAVSDPDTAQTLPPVEVEIQVVPAMHSD